MSSDKKDNVTQLHPPVSGSLPDLTHFENESGSLTSRKVEEMKPQFEPQTASKRPALKWFIGIGFVLILLIMALVLYPSLLDVGNHKAMIPTAIIDEQPEKIVAPPTPEKQTVAAVTDSVASSLIVSDPADESVVPYLASKNEFVLGSPVALSSSVDTKTVMDEVTQAEPVADIQLETPIVINAKESQPNAVFTLPQNSEYQTLQQELRLAVEKITSLQETIQALKQQISQHDQAIAGLQRSSSLAQAPASVIKPVPLKAEVPVSISSRAIDIPVLLSIRTIGTKTFARFLLNGNKFSLSVGDAFLGWTLTDMSIKEATVKSGDFSKVLKL